MSNKRSCEILFYCDKCGVFIGYKGYRTTTNAYCEKHKSPKTNQRVQASCGVTKKVGDERGQVFFRKLPKNGGYSPSPLSISSWGGAGGRF